ncbi:MAG: hypothetical protein PHY26_01935 [Bacilli bacterium]|jgi:hypothetical protein|nr:hypothetical protein [Bacilli bacterium]
MKLFLKFIFITIIFISGCISVKADNNKRIYELFTDDNIIYIMDENDTFQYSWKFNRYHVNNDLDINLNLYFNSPNQAIINQKINDSNIKRKHLYFEHHGELPTTALIKVKVSDQFKEGQKLYLYHYDEESNDLKYVAKNLIVKNGYVEFKINHCSDYVLTGSIVRKAIDNPEGMTVVIVILIVVIVISVGATLFFNRK